METLPNTSLSPESIEHKTIPTARTKSPEVVPESGNRRHSRLGTRQQEPEHLPCPRCDSTNTKFCYYNNYNLSQPRHFCKSCRRYWTRGGALRNVPVGGGTRKTASSSNKRSRIVTTSNDNDNDVTVMTQVVDSVAPNPNLVSGSPEAAPVNLSDAKSGSLSWWSSGSGLFPFNNYGVGYGPGLDYDHAVLNWPMEDVGGGEGGATVVSGESSGFSTWQIGGGAERGGVAEGDYFSWPELTISTPAKALK